jgi:hypothetical protein
MEERNTNKVYPKDLGLKSSRLIQDVVDDFKFQPSLQVISFQQTKLISFFFISI